MEIVGIWRYPVKSLQGEALDAAVVERDGLEGDRRWGVRDGRTGRILTARRRSGAAARGRVLPRTHSRWITLPDGRIAEGPGPRTDRLLSEWLGSSVALVTAVVEAPGRAEYFEDAADDTSQAIEWTMPDSRYVDAAALLVLTTGLAAHGGRAAPRRGLGASTLPAQRPRERRHREERRRVGRGRLGRADGAGRVDGSRRSRDASAARW